MIHGQKDIKLGNCCVDWFYFRPTQPK